MRGCTRPAASVASVVMMVQVAHQAAASSSSATAGSRQNSYSPAIAITSPPSGRMKYGCLYAFAVPEAGTGCHS